MIIAEIGTSHEGSIEKAKQLIDASCDAGADYIKFQWVYAHEILHPDTGFVKLPTGNIPLYDRFKRGYVVDYFSFKFLRKVIFNISDICIIIGAVILMILGVFHKN